MQSQFYYEELIIEGGKFLREFSTIK